MTSAGLRRPVPVPEGPILCKGRFGPPRCGTAEAIEDKIGDTVQGNPVESNALRRQGSIWRMALWNIQRQITYQ